MKKLSIILAIIALLLMGQNTQQQITGRVNRVIDGDTVDLLDSANTRFRIRMDGIDAPESNQEYGKESTEKLSTLVLNKDVRVLSSGRDKYGRFIGRIYVDKVDVNLEMVKTGCAWHYKYYSKDEALAKAEIAAQEKELGLWSLPDPIPPWNYRKIRRLRIPPTPLTENVVYITQTGHSYHKKGCSHSGDKPIAVDLIFAKKSYKPCLVCKPPK
jgi:endonuclease YncB( thermonuclease family)